MIFNWNSICLFLFYIVDDIKQRPKCNISGEIYYDGERFVVDSDPDLRCYCQPGYQGEKEKKKRKRETKTKFQQYNY